ncbi:MAG: hypothetical protein GF388_03415 [Candidatus Aegiribacteria sp.]|nr:hypothetical protein [Candidatus Aegiribacteria sp.]MBD3294313.1 hypothetical protein [Candidatus Fermentibacteria bacterium]
MKRVVLIVCLLAIAGTSFAGFSIGFKHTEFPTQVVTYTTGDWGIYLDDMYLLRFGAMASPQFRLEGLVGYAKESYEIDPSNESYPDYDGSMMAFGGGGYYVLEMPANTSFSIGLQVLYGTSSYEQGSDNGPDTKVLSVDPLMRIDFAIPGAERLAFFTEYGIRYAQVTTTWEGTGGADDVDLKWSGYQTYSPANILAGAYYVF